MFLLSKPLRLRGLKYDFRVPIVYVQVVEAFAASWIEIIFYGTVNRANLVEAFAASWIEIRSDASLGCNVPSKPLRLRGLKFTTF